MLKLKYKIKKIIRFINKFLRVILIFGCIASLLTFNASASVYVDKTDFYDIFGDDVLIQVESDIGHDTETIELDPFYINGGDAYGSYIPSQYISLEKLDIVFGGNASLGGYLSSGNVLIFKGNFGVRDRLNSSNFINQFSKVNCDIVLLYDYGSIPLANVEPQIKYMDSYQYSYYEYDIQLTIPNDLEKYNSPRIAFIFDFKPINNLGVFSDCYIFKSTNMKLWYGDEESAPIYPEYNDNINDNYSGYEDNLMNESQAGFDEFNSLRGETTEILQSGSFLNGALFVTNIYNHLTRDLPWFNSILKVSLTLGLFVVLLTTSITIGKRVK